MKIYILGQGSVDGYSIYGVYTSKELAEKDMDFIGNVENETSVKDNHFQERWIKIDDKWHNQTRSKFDESPWPEWEPFEPYMSMETIYIKEVDIESMSLQDKVDAINWWQNQAKYVHPLTCGNDSNHPNLVPKYNYDGDIDLVCEKKIDDDIWCGWRQTYSHPILSLVYATYQRFLHGS